MNFEQIARICHEANRAYCITLGDNSQLTWDDAPEWQRTSALNGVKFHISNPDAKASHSHECWLKEKRANGWKFGPVKDSIKKEHPCIVPFSELPQEQRIKDYLFKSIVHAFVESEDTKSLI